jgi:putative ABC transport system permease protein
MFIFRLVMKNLLRHKLRTFLTIVGIAVAVMAFNLMKTVVTAWNSGVAASAANRLVTVHSVSFIFPLPYSYLAQIEKIPGVKRVSYANWFSGIYIDENQFFARMAVDPETIWDLYPEFIITEEAKEALKRTQNGCVIGVKIAKQYNLHVGDIMPMEGDIYPGHWEMKVVGFYQGKDETVDETQMLFNWHYLDEQVRQTQPGRAGQVGWYLLSIDNPNDRARISAAVDALFANSPAETKTQTEKEFQQSFVSMSGAILTAINVVSYVIIGIILLVLSNTMVMTARERIREYAVMKTLGFSSFHLGGLIAGESLAISSLGGLIGLAMSFPIVEAIHKGLPSGWFPVFALEPFTIGLAIVFALLAGVAAAIFPIGRAARMKIVDGLRQIG